MQFSTAIIALAMGQLLQLGGVAALPTEIGVDVSVPKVAADVAAKVHTIEKRHDHTACACQTSSGGEIDAAATSRVAGFNMNRWVLDLFETQRFQGGAKFTGYYIRGKDGASVSGEGFYNECRQNGAADSTCF
ncbi:hypothetical protein COCCADRAFT_31097 [Bipolaris zeicola 26-R-13]|uniref:Uncharacterized protein n=1 Tax=Cochliobolus carbonum (strain 26-R-13) TaxID=930089 RepID=W6XJS5_COCC2|nr:uncharacterized protein COCCADRAFT_31097 [Bipolaris zeicola 26-R-13]EUC27427.1 hypothetical protein COCCADRAFT_31097 [Bipolaris zeicola 26-R-13]